MTEPQNRIAIAGLAFALLLLPTTADATEFHCGETFITFPTHEGSYGGEKTIGGIVTVPERGHSNDRHSGCAEFEFGDCGLQETKGESLVRSRHRRGRPPPHRQVPRLIGAKP